MSCSAIMFSLFLTSPCPDGGGMETSQAVTDALANPQRPAEDVARDASRKPDEVLSFFDIKPGMTVFDMFSGGGYYTEILDTLVGEDGKVIAHNNKAYLDYVGETLEKRHAGGRLAQTESLISEVNDLEFEAGSLDAALFVLTWHDFLFADPDQGWPAIDRSLLLSKLCMAMKPGAVLGLVDHTADPGGDAAEIAKTLHRVDPQLVRDDFAGSCFKLEAEAGFLQNPDDDHSLSVFDPAIRGQTDRFVYKFVRK